MDKLKDYLTQTILSNFVEELPIAGLFVKKIF